MILIYQNKIKRNNKVCYNTKTGEVPKRLKGAVSKTARGCKSRMGSNPIFSAIKIKRNDRIPVIFYSTGLMKKFPYTCSNAVTVIKALRSTLRDKLITWLTCDGDTTI